LHDASRTSSCRTSAKFSCESNKAARRSEYRSEIPALSTMAAAGRRQVRIQVEPVQGFRQMFSQRGLADAGWTEEQ
jgi:hypothetical protein